MRSAYAPGFILAISVASQFTLSGVSASADCPADLSGDGLVDGQDIGLLFANWGSRGPEGDLDQDGSVGGSDLGALMSAWGECPAESNDTLLIPGTGFQGETVELSPVGLPGEPGYENKPMARWDVVPYQTVDQEFQVGIVAYHFGRIDRVEFSLDGGPWLPVNEMKQNPRTGQDEYWVTIDPSTMADGNHEIRAIVWPNVGTPRIMAGQIDDEAIRTGEHSLFLSSNHGRTLGSLDRWVSKDGSDQTGDGSREKPYASMMKAARSIQDEQGKNADGGTIYLLPGSHSIGTYSWGLHTYVDDRWLTITHDPQTPMEKVLVTGVESLSGLRAKLLRFHRLNIQMPDDGSISQYIFSSASGQSKWVSECNLNGPGRLADGDWGSGGVANYVTDTTIENCKRPFMGAIYRNIDLRHIGVDAMRGQICKLVLDVTVEDLNGCGSQSGAHNDVLQFHAEVGAPPISNGIYRGIISIGGSCSGQGIFFGTPATGEDLAFVDCIISNQEDDEGYVARVMQFGGPVSHLVIEGCTLVGPANWRSDQDFVTEAARITDSWFDYANTEFLIPYPDKHASFEPYDPEIHWDGSFPWKSPVQNVHYELN
ncbi:MAG: hypothetical protein CMJ32_10995 [Phycisphaerae bacterium]|nr:hypothetical protein [Phycisphaerae bacterium]